jgi:hypothetical protein
MIAFAFLLQLRMNEMYPQRNKTDHLPTLPQVRHVVHHLVAPMFAKIAGA